MAINKVEICGVDTSTLPVLKNERMRELFPRIHAGDKEARREFIQGQSAGCAQRHPAVPQPRR